MNAIIEWLTKLCWVVPLSWRVFPCNDNVIPEGDARWPSAFPKFCSGQAQSPINLRDDIAVNMPSGVGPFVFNDAYYDTPRQMVLVNTGKNVLLQPADGVQRELSGGGLDGSYVFHSVHLHFGSNTTAPASDHWLNGRGFSTEMHFVHYRAEYNAGLAEALRSQRRDAMAVLGVFYDTSGPPSDGIADLMNGVRIDPALLRPNNRVEVKPFSLMRLLPDKILGDYFRYYGSLTSPKCNEVVVWTVFRTPLRVQQNSVDEIFGLMRNLRLIAPGRDPLNRRPQPLHGRVIMRSAKQP